MPTDAQLDPPSCKCLLCDGLGMFPDWGVVMDDCVACKGTGKLTQAHLAELVRKANHVQC